MKRVVIKNSLWNYSLVLLPLHFYFYLSEESRFAYSPEESDEFKVAIKGNLLLELVGAQE